MKTTGDESGKKGQTEKRDERKITNCALRILSFFQGIRAGHFLGVTPV